MYLTSFLGFLTLVSGVLGFIGLGFGSMNSIRIFFFIFLVGTLVSFFLAKSKKRRKYYD